MLMGRISADSGLHMPVMASDRDATDTPEDRNAAVLFRGMKNITSADSKYGAG